MVDSDRDNTLSHAQILFNKLGLIKEEIAQIVMASQLAKRGIVHSHLLNKGDILNILSQTNTLPSKNELEALQFAEPSMVIKDSLLLYIISIPQTEDTLFNNVALRSTITNKKRIFLKFKNVLISQKEKYGIVGKCLEIDNVTICKQNQIEKLSNDNCIVRILEGETASCEYQIEKQHVVELVLEGTLFVTNFVGNITYSNISQELNGTFIMNFFNETVTVNNVSYSNWQTVSLQILPPIIKNNVTKNEARLDLQYLHHLHLDNIKRIKDISYKGLFFISSNLSMVFIGFFIIISFQLYSKYKNNRGAL